MNSIPDLEIALRPVEVWIGGDSSHGEFHTDGLWYLWIRVGGRVFLSKPGFSHKRKAMSAAREVAADVRGAVK